MGNKVAVVILNYNGEHFLKQFIANVVDNSPQADVIVVDNQSTDNSVDYLTTHHPKVKTVVLDQNYGFTGGYNRAIADIKHQYTVLLNSDIEVSPNWLTPMIAFMDSNPHVAACQPKILDYNQKDHFEYAGAAGGYLDALAYPFCRGRIFDTLEKDQGQYNDPAKVFWATGAAMFIRTALYQQSGGLDEDFFAHMEEIDLCWRLQRLGHDIYCIPKSEVYHVGGGTLNKINPKKTYLNFRNNLCMLFKNEPALGLTWKLPIKLVLDGVAALKLWKDHSLQHVLAIVKAHWHFFYSIPSLLKKRTSQTSSFETSHTSYRDKSILIAYYFKGLKTADRLKGRG